MDTKAKIFFFPFFYHTMGMGILIPQPGMEPVIPAWEMQTLNHWTTREVPKSKLKGMY